MYSPAAMYVRACTLYEFYKQWCAHTRVHV